MDLSPLNASLKSRAIRGTVVAVSGSLYWRVAVTDAQGKRGTKRIRLALKAQPTTLLKAENRVVELAGLIEDLGHLPSELPWDAPVPAIKTAANSVLTVAEAVERLEKDFWQSKMRTSAAERTWARITAETDRLPQQATLTMDLLVGVGEQQVPGSRTRVEFLKVSKRLAKLVGVEGTDRLDALRTPYEPEARDIPSDAEVAWLLETVMADPTWGWCSWALATYGCRPAEVFSLRPADDGTAQVLTIKRKGKLPTWRTALALPVAGEGPGQRSVPWDVAAPAKYDSAQAKLQCDRWQGWLKRRVAGAQLYDLRHAWAIRSISKLPSTSIAAKCMGHDIAVHHRTYHRWLDQSDIAAIARQLQTKN
ncbi:hypothetical protein [Synechococcus sp. RS9916]|uniref:hypothetical protein n=1 Tax=Synechococcus sp. RS9916 TaxID=221359 RepID=UPI0000E53FFB|nr:hypothetical protein [Synechococcus sp. RS9916]EAU73928.1 possible phage integrase [Synechococcus sp. RS9916]